MSVSGFSGHYKSVLGAGAKAKSVTNNLPLLSVLAVGVVKIVTLPEVVLKNEIILSGSVLNLIKFLHPRRKKIMMLMINCPEPAITV